MSMIPRPGPAAPKLVFDLWLWRHGGQTNFTAMVFDLIAKADPMNRQRIALGFPEHIEVYMQWMMSESEGEFFAQWGGE